MAKFVILYNNTQLKKFICTSQNYLLQIPKVMKQKCLTAKIGEQLYDIKSTASYYYFSAPKLSTADYKIYAAN